MQITFDAQVKTSLKYWLDGFVINNKIKVRDGEIDRERVNVLCCSVDLTIQVWALALCAVLLGVILDFNLTVPWFTKNYKWVPANYWGNNKNAGGNPVMI